MKRPKPIVLLILDGWGLPTGKPGDAIHAAHTPHWDSLIKNSPHTALSCSGEMVGLPPGQMGNSEVGHLTIGAGRVIDQDLSRITHAIQQGIFFENPILKKTFTTMGDTTLHLLGLFSPGGVHSHEDHILACIQMACQHGVKRILLHLFLDGRDTPPQSAKASLEKLEQYLAKFPQVRLASLSGRYYAMDRDQRWDRVKQAYDAIVHGQSRFTAPSGLEALASAYARDETDEFVTPTCILEQGISATVHSNDSVVYMNFRSDRARALAYALGRDDFSEFDRGSAVPTLRTLVTLTEYDPALNSEIAFPPQTHRNILTDILATHQMKQLRLAETEKYAHVTFFFNGGKEIPSDGETRILIPSPKVATYDLCPNMSVFEVTDVLVNNIKAQYYDFIVCNFANADMVGHTGNFDATVRAIETLDICLGKVVEALRAVKGEALITADHGNAECMIDTDNQQPHTAHTSSLVPLIYVGERPWLFTQSTGTLSDIAPTILFLMGLTPPPDMTGTILCKEARDDMV